MTTDIREIVANHETPLWRVSYQYNPQPSDIDSYISFETVEAAMLAVNEMINDARYSNVRISWPHSISEPPPGDGWIATEDLTAEQKQSLDLILTPHEKPQ